MFPLPACPKCTMGTAWRADNPSMASMRAGRRDTGTATSSLIFLGASVRRAGERALRAAQRSAASSPRVATARSSSPAPFAAAPTALAACSTQSEGPSTSMRSRAAVSCGRATPGAPRTRSTASPPMYSSAEGMTGWAMIRATAAAAPAMSR